MNLQTSCTPDPLKVLVVNPLIPAARLIIAKMLSGVVFGENQLIDIILLVYSNERNAAELFTLELYKCGFSSFNSITVSSDLPCLSDADVFCFITNFSNPNFIDTGKSDNNEQFDTLYLIIKIAHNLSGIVENKSNEKGNDIDNLKKTKKTKSDSARKPIFMADGLVTIAILKALSKDMPDNVFYCPSALSDIAKSVLAEHLKVQCNEINNVLIWAAHDAEFHVEFEKPLIIHDNIVDNVFCDWDVISKNMLDTADLDHTQFSASWMKKDLVQKVASLASKNPYGCIYRAAQFTKTLRDIWLSYSCGENMYIRSNIGIVSDGSLGTIKGYPYILPLLLNRGSWKVNTLFEENTHLKHDIKRMNKIVKEYHYKLIPYCKKFLEENVIKQAFIPVEEQTVSTISETSDDTR